MVMIMMYSASRHTKGNAPTCNAPRNPIGNDIDSKLHKTSTKKIPCDIYGNNLNLSTNLDSSFDFQNDVDEAKHFCSTPTKNSWSFNTSNERSALQTNELICTNSAVSQNSIDRISTNSQHASPINHEISAEKTSFRKSYISTNLCLRDFMSSSTPKVKNRKTVKENVQSKSTNSSILSVSDFPAIGTRTPKSNQKILGSTSSSTTNANNAKDDSSNVTSVKPRKRVAPITVKPAAQNNFGSIVYRTDNNLLEVHNDDTRISRDLLKTHIDVISKEFENESVPMQIYGQCKKQSDSTATVPVQIDLTRVTHKDVLNRMILIYAIVIDSNLTTNCLTEISFLLNLLNAEFTNLSESQQQAMWKESSVDTYVSVDELFKPNLLNRQCDMISSLIFKNAHNCVYFSAGVLSKQKHLLMLLDITTIKVLMDSERLMEYGEGMKEFLANVFLHKLQLDSIKCSSHDVSFKQGSGNNVFYQEDNDTKEHFPSMREFSSFKNQRDGFYSVLRIWESNHFNQTWNFAADLGPKIRSLLGIMRHPINMAHMAKLFTSQLILSCNFEDTSSDLQQQLQIDPTKLSKLQQRLITPSYFATDYMYPGSQAFFRDFLTAADTEIGFIEQLKIVLINELLQLNDSSFETLNLSSGSNKMKQMDEYVVRPETVAIMRVLAKFLGLIYVKPFAFDGIRNFGVDSRQIELRNMAYPLFDIKAILKKAINDHRLIVTIPWLVQFLSMLDYITLRLNYFVDIFNILYDLYIMSTNVNYNQKENRVRPTSIFILRTCLGWLFEQSNVPDEYYKYRRNRAALTSDEEMCSVQVLVPKSISDYFNNQNIKITDHQINPCFNAIQCTLEKIDTTQSDNLSLNNIQRYDDELLTTLDPMMENILNAACPFLRDFRVSIIPLKYSKTVSRSGKYRHITTKTTKSKLSKYMQDQIKLAEAFLQSQSLSVRRTIEFVIERTVSAVIKDFQMEILIPTKRQINDEINSINETEKRKLTNQMYERYVNGHLQLSKKWDAVIPGMIRDRVKKALNALLPNETLSIVKLTCINLAVQNCIMKTTEWKNFNLGGIDFFTKDLSGDANKILKMRSVLGKQSNILIFDFTALKMFPSKILGQLQVEVHYASMIPESTTLSKIEGLVNDLTDLLDHAILPSPICKTICFSTMHLVSLLVCNRPDLIQANLLDNLIKLWNCKILEYWTKPKEYKDNSESQQDNIPTNNVFDTRHIFSNILNNCLMHKLANCKTKSFEALERVLITLINENFSTIPLLNEQIVALFREEWPEELLQQVSSLLLNVASKSCKSDNQYECLFLEMLSDLSSDLMV